MGVHKVYQLTQELWTDFHHQAYRRRLGVG